MGSPLTNRTIATYETDVVALLAFIMLDGASNVVGSAPTLPGAINTSTTYTRAKGLQKALGPAGGVLLQPHTATGTYIFTLDEPWMALIGAGVDQNDPGAVAPLQSFIDANVTYSQTVDGNGYLPGRNLALAPQTVRVRFRNNADALTDPVASTGFWLNLILKRSGVL